MPNGHSEEPLRRALQDFEYGDFETKIDAIVKIARIDQGKIEELAENIQQMFQNASGGIDVVIGAAKLARNGVKVSPVVRILLHVLKEFSTDPDGGRVARFMVIEAMSYIKDEPEVVEALKQLCQYGSGFDMEKDYAFWALGAIGDPGSKAMIEYAARQGTSSAKAALNLFGTGSFRQIQTEATGFDATAQKKSGCFVATAVFDGADAAEVLILRSFRDQCLVKYPVGRFLITVYEHVGPKLAVLVSRFKPFKHISRAVLRSLVGILLRTREITPSH